MSYVGNRFQMRWHIVIYQINDENIDSEKKYEWGLVHTNGTEEYLYAYKTCQFCVVWK